jgi:hypothetical protein
MITNAPRSSCEVPTNLSDFNETYIYSKDFKKTLKYEVSWKVRPVEAELFNADRRTDSKI